MERKIEITERDIRGSALFREAEQLYTALRRPGTGDIFDASGIHACVRTGHAVFTGTFADRLDAGPATRICRIDLASGDLQVLTFGPNRDRLPKYSPDGRHIAFLSDRQTAGEFQLYILDPLTGTARPTPAVQGWVEYLHWSPDGKKILLGAAGHGADLSGGQGAVASAKRSDKLPSWMPEVDTGNDDVRWRRVWVYELATHSIRCVSPRASNVWEANWCGNDAIVAIASAGPGEGLWYGASLQLFDIATARDREIYKPRDQLGWPAATNSGSHVAVVEAVASDRWVVAGALLIVDTATHAISRVETGDVDITSTEWLGDERLLLAGHRGLETVVCIHDRTRGKTTEVWRSQEITTGITESIYAKVAALGVNGDCLLIGEGYVRAPEIAMICGGEYKRIKSLAPPDPEYARSIASIDSLRWRARDGLEIQGWLLRPHGRGPHPLIMAVHGGPVSHHRPAWLGRGSIATLMLTKRGYAIFYPNPRGSSGRGSDFARHVLGEMGGADASDCLAGLDVLVEQGIADPKRLGITGGSYGGFMTLWIISQDSRFSAAVSVAPITNHVSHHLTSNIPHFVKLFLNDRYTRAEGKYFSRSPIMYAHRVVTPTLNICGALDRCTPASEALQFHNALLENGVESALVRYPEEGHGVRVLPAAIDYAARVVGWFDSHILAAKDPIA